MRAAWAAAPVALALLAAAVAAATQDPATYPPGVLAVSNTPIEGGEDFEVTVRLADAADAVAVTVCRFRTQAAPSPDVCYMNLGAKAAGDSWTASTSAVEHPAWRNGWVIGYKATVEAGGAERHAPDRVTSTGEPDYYRIVVGSPQEDLPKGTAVVEDAPAPDDGGAGAPAPAPRESPALPALAALGALAAALLARR